MYRHATHTDCAGCGAAVAYQQAELDGQARFICGACGARDRFDAALVRWRRQSVIRSGWTRLGVVALALLAAVYLLPPFLLLLFQSFFGGHFC